MLQLPFLFNPYGFQLDSDFKYSFSLNQLMGFVAEERRHYTVYPPPDQVFTWTQMCDIRDVSTSCG